MSFRTVRYEVSDRIATRTPDRPEHDDPIAEGMPSEIRRAAEQTHAERDSGVPVASHVSR